MLHTWSKVKKIGLLLGIAGLSSCVTSGMLSGKARKDINHLVVENPLFSSIHSGFALFDPEAQSWLYTSDAEKYYTPASNTKLFTLYAFMKICGDRLPTLRYARNKKGLIIQGTGSPLLLHPDLPSPKEAWRLLREEKGRIWYSTDNFQDQRLGPGWSWSDYNFGYQAEVSPLPVYGNLIRVVADSTRSGFTVYPNYYRFSFRYTQQLDEEQKAVFVREEFKNRFSFNQSADTSYFPTKYIPFFDARQETGILLGDTLGKPVMLWPPHEMLPDTFTTIYEPVPDTLLQQLMKDSDNFLAEQLLLCVSHELLHGNLHARATIDSLKATILSDLPDEPRWVDGSGLSRYNLFTPRSMVMLLEKLRSDFGENRLFDIMAAGGQSGTIRNWYPGPEGKPFIFAKTGTLSNKHALSGYLKTKSGKTLIFSFMHNNYLGSSNPLKVEMNKVFLYLYHHY